MHDGSFSYFCNGLQDLYCAYVIILEHVCRLTPVLCVRTDWASAKSLLGDSNFLKRLYDYDKDNIPEKMLKQLKKYMENPKFVPEQVEKVSKVGSLGV